MKIYLSVRLVSSHKMNSREGVRSLSLTQLVSLSDSTEVGACRGKFYRSAFPSSFVFHSLERVCSSNVSKVQSKLLQSMEGLWLRSSSICTSTSLANILVRSWKDWEKQRFCVNMHQEPLYTPRFFPNLRTLERRCLPNSYKLQSRQFQCSV